MKHNSTVAWVLVVVVALVLLQTADKVASRNHGGHNHNKAHTRAHERTGTHARTHGRGHKTSNDISDDEKKIEGAVETLEEELAGAKRRAARRLHMQKTRMMQQEHQTNARDRQSKEQRTLLRIQEEKRSFSSNGEHVCVWGYGIEGGGGMANTFGYTNAALDFAVRHGFRYFWADLTPTGHLDSFTQDMTDIFGGSSDPFDPFEPGTETDRDPEKLLTTSARNKLEAVDMPFSVEAYQQPGCRFLGKPSCLIDIYNISIPERASVASSSHSVRSSIDRARELPDPIHTTDAFHQHRFMSEYVSDEFKRTIRMNTSSESIYANLNDAGFQCKPYQYNIRSYHVGNTGDNNNDIVDSFSDGHVDQRGEEAAEDITRSDCCVIIGVQIASVYPIYDFDETRDLVRSRYRVRVRRNPDILHRTYRALLVDNGDVSVQTDGNAIAGDDITGNSNSNDKHNSEQRGAFGRDGLLSASDSTKNPFDDTFLILVHFRLGDLESQDFAFKRMSTTFPIMCLDVLMMAMKRKSSADSLPIRVALLAEAPSSNTEVLEILQHMRLIDPKALHLGDNLSAALTFHAMANADILIASFSGFSRLAAVVKPEGQLTIAPQARTTGADHLMAYLRNHPLQNFGNVEVLDLTPEQNKQCAHEVFFTSVDPVDIQKCLRKKKNPVDFTSMKLDLFNRFVVTARKRLPKRKFDSFFDPSFGGT